MKTGKKYRGIRYIKGTNICGYSSLTEEIKNFAKKNKAILVFSFRGLLSLSEEQLMSDQYKIVIDAFPLVLTSGVPVLGYTQIGGLYTKIPLRFQKSKNRKIEIHGAFKRLSLELQDQVVNAKKKRKLLNTLDKKSDEHALVKSMFSIHLPASQFDKDPNDNSKSRPDNQSE